MEKNPEARPKHAVVRALVGCRTTRQRAARGQGISAFCPSTNGEAWGLAQCLPAGDNPSFLVIGHGERRLYCVHGDGETVASFGIAADGQLAHLNEVPTGGRNPVHLALCPGETWMLVANYATGSLVSLAVDDHGCLDGVASLLELPNKPGPRHEHQQGSHPHQVVFDPSGRWVVVPDKGSDRLHTVELDDATGSLRLAQSFICPPGSGPRHIAFDEQGTRAWLVHELSSEVASLQFNPTTGTFELLQIASTVPSDFQDANSAAGIFFNSSAKSLWVSNRGHGSVARFTVHSGGLLGAPMWQHVGGTVPRFICKSPFVSDGAVVANEDADTIESIAFDGKNFSKTPLAATGSPVCITFIQGPV